MVNLNLNQLPGIDPVRSLIAVAIVLKVKRRCQIGEGAMSRTRWLLKLECDRPLIPFKKATMYLTFPFKVWSFSYRTK
ncbi:hypothetical protein [Leptothermofonsia sp. ETS-13]|uniref:hypothetical protein n=1 Tax=Leptothermofonsia sp. ETS-13 TaxID=3035696 RepID=UPI003BA2D1CB